ncbi:MAG: hypothetical protein P8173_12540 [Gammaproteobacteria bacterium]
MQNFGSWSVLTTDFLIVLYLALNGVTFSSILHLANGKWRFAVRHLACSMSVLFPIAGILLVILLVKSSSTFAWVTETVSPTGEHIIPNKWRSVPFLVVREVVGFLVIWGLYRLFIKYQALSEVDKSYAVQRRFRNIALLIPFVYVLYGTMVAWDFEMTQFPGWRSDSYGFYFFQSNFHMFLGFFSVVLYFLIRSGKLAKEMPAHIMNYMAQFMLGMTILWTDLYFTQYLIMGYGRLPEVMNRYWYMMYHALGPLWWTFLALKFVIPFCTLAITPNRHNPAVIAFVGGSIVIGTWIERYTWIAGSVAPKYYHIPMTSVVDVLFTVGIAVVAYIAVKWSMTRQGLIRA